MTLRNEMIERANEVGMMKGNVGSFICTDGEWCSCRGTKEFKEFIERQGFEVESCIETETCSALATTKDGYQFAYNGFCKNLNK